MLGGSVWYTLFVHAWLPRFFLGNLETMVYVFVFHDRTLNHCTTRNGSESSHIKVVSSGKEVALMNQAVLHALSKVRKPGMVLKDEQTLAYAGSPLSFVTATRNIRPRWLGRSSSSPWIVNNPLACLASTSERQKRHSKVFAITRHWLCYTHQVFLRVTIYRLHLCVAMSWPKCYLVDVYGTDSSVDLISKQTCENLLHVVLSTTIMLYKQKDLLTGILFLDIYPTNHNRRSTHLNESDMQCMPEIGRQSWCNACPWQIQKWQTAVNNGTFQQKIGIISAAFTKYT